MSLVLAELTATCNALGYAISEKNKYFLDKECKEALRDLIRFLRKDDESYEIRKHLGYAKILQTDLLPILIHHHNDAELLDLLLRLLVNLTTPALLLYNEEPPTERVSRQYYLTLLNNLQQYKESFANSEIWSVLAGKLTELLGLEWHERSDEKGLTIVRILILIRNVLHVPIDTDAERRADNDTNIHDKVLWSLYEGGMINLILFIANSDNEQQYYFHVLEITSLMFRDQNAEILASVSVQRSLAEKEKETNELIAIRRKEQQERQQKMKKYIAARHSRFGGTYVLQGVKSVGNNDLIVHSLSGLQDAAFDQNKARIKIPKNRRAMQSEISERRSAFSIRLFLKEYCIEFLNGCYNNLMNYVRELIIRGKAQANDESYYFWAMRFFMEFNRHHGFQVKFISETVSVQIFHFIQERIEDWREKFIVDKKKIHLWSKRIHLALKAYMELLNTLYYMYKSPERSLQECSRTILSNIFYIVEYRELLMVLLNTFDEVKFSKEYLKDLIETNHIFMKMLEHFSKHDKSLVVQKKTKIIKRKKKKKANSEVVDSDAAADVAIVPSDEQWEQMEVRLLECLNNKQNLTEHSPAVAIVDFASDVPVEEQNVEALRKIKYSLVNNRVEEAAALLIAAREIWPMNDSFGASDMLPEEDCLILKDIYFADLIVPPTITTSAAAVLENDEENESEYTENEEEEGIADSANSLSEQYFDFPAFIKRFVRPKIIQACCLLLAQFEGNTSSTNHSVLKLLHRIAFDCKFEAMLFQASVFRTFQRILASSDSQHKELQKFAVYIVRKFVTLAQRDSKAFVDFLFWKNNIEAYEMIEGIGSFSNKQQDKTVLWSEEQEDELRRLCVEYEKDKPDEDMVDWIHKNLINASRSRRGLIKKLKELYLLPEKGSRSKSARPPKEFSEQEILQISQLFNEHRNAEDPIGSMLNLLDVKRPRKRIIDKIVELGLVQDRKELRKKTNRKKSSQQNDESGSENEQSTEDDYSDDDDENRNVDNEGNYVENEFGPATHGDPSTSSRRNNEKRITEKSHDYSLSSKIVTDSIAQVVRNGMKESIDWILECFEEFLDDITDSESDVPLVPLTENAVKALDNKTFQQMLTYIGIRRPSDEQEVYWRISGNWQANDIRKRIEVIKNVTNNECSNADESLRHQTNVESTEANFTDSYNDNENQCVNDSVNETVETIAINNDENDHHDAVDNTINNRISEISDGINGDEDEMRLKNNRKRIHRIVDSSDEDDAADSLVENLNTSDNFDEPSMVVGRNQNTFSFNNNKRRKIIAIDSDSE